MTTGYRVLLLVVALSLISCASSRGFPDRMVTSDKELEVLMKYYQPETITNYTDATEEPTRKKIRDEIINARITATDIQFSLFQKKLHQEGVGMNLASDAIVLGIGATGALVSGGTSKVLSAASAAVTGIKGSIDKKLFFEQTMPALFAQMLAKRKSVLVNIRAGLTRLTSEYPLHQGLADLEEYRYAGTIPGAIASVVESAGAQSAGASKELKNILTIGFEVTDDTTALKRWLYPNNTYNKLRFDYLDNWLRDNNIRDKNKKIMPASIFRDNSAMRIEIKKFLNHLKE